MYSEFGNPGQDTVFDVCWQCLQRRIRGLLQPLRGHGWALLWLSLTLLFSGYTLYFLVRILLPAGSGGVVHEALDASLGALLLAMIMVRHFSKQALERLGLGNTHQRRLWAQLWIGGLIALVVLPLSLWVVFQAHTLWGVLLLLAYGLAAQPLWLHLREWLRLPRVNHGRVRQQGACASHADSDRGMRLPSPPDASSDMRLPAKRDDCRAMLMELRRVGVNMRIAGVLVKAGYTTADALRLAGDEQLLAIRGVGPATVRKIRSCFA